VTDHLPTLEREIKTLLEPSGLAPARDVVEHTLTTGYAHALRLDAERLRVESRLRLLLRSGSAGQPELADATGELGRVESELARLRALLATLRAQAL